MCKTKCKTPHWVGRTKYSYDFDFEVIGVFFVQKNKKFLFSPCIFPSEPFVIWEKKIKFIFICKNPSLRSDIWGTNYICLKRIGPDSRTNMNMKSERRNYMNKTILMGRLTKWYYVKNSDTFNWYIFYF